MVDYMKIIVTLLIVTFVCRLPLLSQKFEGLAQTPPMGWNSWNIFKCEINEVLIREVADSLISSGMKDAGYEYIVIDDCWQIDRDSSGTIVADPRRFPSGIKALAEYIHSKGLKFGLYSDAGKWTCRMRPGSLGYEEQDAETYASWGVDYLKYDWCFNGNQNSMESYTRMRDALFKAGRPIVFSICEWGTTKPWEWAAEVGHLWRTTRDIIDMFDGTMPLRLGILEIIDKQLDIREHAGPGRWNDLDMLEVGNPGLNLEQSRSHFSMWCMLSAPLMAGNDLRNMSEETAEILSSIEVIAINQDSLGIPAIRWKTDSRMGFWIKPLNKGDYAICFLNRGRQPYKLKTTLSGLKITDKDFENRVYEIDDHFLVEDLWNDHTLGYSSDPIQQTIGGQGVLLLKLTRKQ